MHYHSRGSGQYIVERSDGFLDILETGPLFQGHEDWQEYEKEAMNSVKGRVLDVGCGAGRHAIYLQNKGFDVLGTDISPLAIEVCKKRGLKNAEVMAIEDVYHRADSFDTVLMLGNNFGLFGNPEKARVLLDSFHTMTTPDALIIASSNDVYRTTNSLHLKYQESNRRRGRMSGQINFRVRFRQYSTPWYDYLMVSKDEMKEILQETGWKVRQYIDSEMSYYVALIEKI